MPRKLNDKNCRLVVSGTPAEPLQLFFEYRVNDDGFIETPQRTAIKQPGFSNTVLEVWDSCVSVANTIEEIE